jgi:hypothetical protein
MAGLLTGMLESHPRQAPSARGDHADIIEAVASCAATCTICADACLSETSVAELVHCIRLNLLCADICTTTAGALSRSGGFDQTLLKPLLEACVAACRACGAECERHSRMHEHCRICADACRYCAQMCQQLI